MATVSCMSCICNNIVGTTLKGKEANRLYVCYLQVKEAWRSLQEVQAAQR